MASKPREHLSVQKTTDVGQSLTSAVNSVLHTAFLVGALAMKTAV